MTNVDATVIVIVWIVMFHSSVWHAFSTHTTLTYWNDRSIDFLRSIWLRKWERFPPGLFFFHAHAVVGFRGLAPKLRFLLEPVQARCTFQVIELVDTMIGVIAPYLAKFHRSYQSNDIIDRLNYQYTALIIVLTAFTLAATQYVGKPIQCWVPAQFTGAWEKYTETYCFIKGSYYMPLDTEIPYEYSRRDESVIGYYQWVPIVLALQAFLFYFPSVVWRTMNSLTGHESLYQRERNSEFGGSGKKKFDKSSRLAQVHTAADHLRDALDMQRALQTGPLDCFQLGKRSGIYLIVLYLFTKVLYVINVILQFVILNAFLGPQYTFWGAGILSDIWHGKEWSESGHFPRVTMCDFHIRVLGNIHRWTVQCVLMINMFNEKVVVCTDWNFVSIVVAVLLFALVLASNQRQFVTRYLRCAGAVSDFMDPKTERYLHGFIRRFLRPDGVFILRLIETNGGDLLVGEIVNVMFAHYRARMEERSEMLAVTDSAHLNGNENLLER
ncbi:Innexin [Dirofilaria immitis]|nr:Innexin [Dirofilaria immitis]